jgi:hypothetical protein
MKVNFSKLILLFDPEQQEPCLYSLREEGILYMPKEGS